VITFLQQQIILPVTFIMLIVLNYGIQREVFYWFYHEIVTDAKDPPNAKFVINKLLLARKFIAQMGQCTW
jgi:hypothetical protein